MDEAREIGGELEARSLRSPLPALQFEDFYRDRAEATRRYAAAILREDGVEDVCQEAWLRIWRAWGNHDPGRVDAWAFRIVRNCCFDRLRGAKPTVTLADALLPVDVSPEEAVASRIDARRAMKLLAVLPLPQREALWLREAAMLSYAEIAAVQGVPVGTVMSRLHKARRRASKALRRWEA